MVTAQMAVSYTHLGINAVRALEGKARITMPPETAIGLSLIHISNHVGGKP